MLRNMLFNLRNWGKVSVGLNVVFDNNGKIESNGPAYLGSIDNQTTKLLNARGGTLMNSGQILLGSNSRIHKGFSIDVKSKFVIGDNSYINPNCLIIARTGIEIGQNCAISWNVSILDNDLHKVQANRENESMSIRIGDGVWIGCNATILKGVRIGDGAIIGANSVVTKNVPAKAMCCGNPAQVVKRNISWA